MKKLIILLAVCSVSALFANNDDMVRVSGQGKIAIVNACSAAASPIESAASDIRRILMLEVETKSGTWSLVDAAKSFENTGANAAVFVVRDPTLPMSLVAMEAKWGIANANGLSDACLKKEILRVATIVLGGASSKYPASTMRAVFTPEDLEKKAGDAITFDSMMSIFNYIPYLGMKQARFMDREDAIEMGVIKE